MKTVICAWCEKPFDRPDGSKVHLCPNCKKRIGSLKHLKGRGSPESLELRIIANKANSMGLSYGEYCRRYGLYETD